MSRSAMGTIAENISIVDDIAYQTNLLALNAAIEAAVGSGAVRRLPVRDVTNIIVGASALTFAHDRLVDGAREAEDAVLACLREGFVRNRDA